MMKLLFAFLFAFSPSLLAGPFPPAAGQEGSEAVAVDDSRIVGWATVVESYESDSSVSESWRDSSQVLGPAEGQSFGVCSLGPGGTLTVSFGGVIPNRLGPEIAVFENGFSDLFLEFAFVEVSSDGVNFVRFQNQSLTPAAVGGFGVVDTTDVFGLAGKYRQGFGTPFDFSDLPADPLLDLKGVRFVRLVDVVGGQANDSSGGVIYDPFPTSISAGFDCDGIALLAPERVPITETNFGEGEFSLKWESVAGRVYAVEASESLSVGSWIQVSVAVADGEEQTYSVSVSEASKRFFRVVTE